MKAVIFVTLSFGMVSDYHTFMTEEAPTAEECLRRFQDRLAQKLDYKPTLTYRPNDGMIFCHAMKSCPIGVLYSQDYASSYRHD